MAYNGSFSLVAPRDGQYIGNLGIDLNLDANNQLLFSPDGLSIEGLNIGSGLQKNSNDLKTIGNPDIQLTSNSIYINDGQQSIQSGIDASTQADVIYVSSGSYGERAIISNKYNMALDGPDVGNTICEVLQGIQIDGTSELIRVCNLQIKNTGTASQISGVGRFYFKNVVFTGTSSQTHTINIGSAVSKYITFMNIEFDQYCQINISSSFTSAIYFINCNFGGATISYQNPSSLQVILNNCAGLVSYPTGSQATLVGLNVLTTGASQMNATNVQLSTINGSAYPPASSGGVSVSNQSNTQITYCTNTSNILTSSSNLTFNQTTNTLATSNLTITNINGSAYPSSFVNISNQSNQFIPYCTSASNALVASSGLAFDVASNTLATVNITCTNINGNPPMSATAQANNRIITATTTTNTLHGNQDLTWDGTNLTLFQTNPIIAGRGNNASSDISNTAFGNKSLNSITIGTKNTSFGFATGSSLANHVNNSYFGYSDAASTGSPANLTSNNCTIVGANNLCFSNTTSNATILGTGNFRSGTGCIIIGTNSRGMANSNNVVIGSNSGAQTGSNDTIIIGSGCHTSNYSSATNADLVIGNNSMRSSSGGYNTAIGGGYAILDSITGTRNIGIGHAAGQLATTGNDNIFIGCLSALNQNVISSNCIVIGNYSQLSSNAATNECCIGNSSLATFRIPGLSLDATSSRFKTNGHYAGSIPVTITADTTIADSTYWLINNKSGSTCVLTLPAAATWPGRILNIQNYQAQLVNSASSNVVPMGGGAAGTAILLAVIGSWITLVSDGTNWIAMKT